MACAETAKEALKETEDFYKTIKAHLDWSDLSQDVVMDIGCGRGYSSRNIVNQFPHVQKVIAIDNLAKTIADAQVTNPHSKIEYRIADIEDICSLEDWEGTISKIVSVNCFHMLDDQKNGFRHLYYLLKPVGEGAILFSLQSNFYDWMSDLLKSQKWKEIFEEVLGELPESHTQMYDESHYTEMLEKVGFDIILCRKEHRRHTYESDEACKNALPRVLLEFGTTHVSDAMKEELFEYFLKHTGRNVDNKIYMPYTILIALVRKPGRIL